MNEQEIEIIDIDQTEKESPKEFSVLDTYGDDLTARTYITDPSIARDEELKRLIIILLTPEKSGLLVGPAGTGKTAIVEGLAYRIQKKEVPIPLQGYRVIKIASSVLTGKIELNGKELLIISLLMEELKRVNKTIVFIDEIHTLMGAKNNGPMDLANILKPGLDRGEVKAIGATTTTEYYTYVIRDRAFLRRFDKIDVSEPDEKTTVEILMRTLPKIEVQTGIKMRYTSYVQELLMKAIVSATSEFKRIYGLAAQYPDVAFSVLTQAFSQALFQNHSEVNVEDVYNAIKTSRRIYPDSIVKELEKFRKEFEKVCKDDNIVLPIVTLDDIKREEEYL